MHADAPVVMAREAKHGARVETTPDLRSPWRTPRTLLRRAIAASIFASCVLSTALAASAAQWSAPAFEDESTLEFRTVNAQGEAHWSTVWLVVLDGDIYVNLGDRAVERLRTNTTAPLVSIRIAGHEFEKIVAEPAQDRQPAVAQAIADKYWTGFLVPYRAPSTVMRLRPE